MSASILPARIVFMLKLFQATATTKRLFAVCYAPFWVAHN